MKNKDLIRVLQALDPEQEVTFSLGSGITSTHRTMCAKAELMKGECLKYLNVSGINITMDETDQSVAIADVILFCDNYPDELLEETAKRYDEEIGENRVWHSWIGDVSTPLIEGCVYVVRMCEKEDAKAYSYAICSFKDDVFVVAKRDGEYIPLDNIRRGRKIDAWMSLE
ncbi:MAG: hypothetical protein UHX00_05225 [Caryophanon sp.]|nr:hypothetical protein [Caryophanon sp.]